MRHFLSKPFEYWKTDWIKTQKCVRHYDICSCNMCLLTKQNAQTDGKFYYFFFEKYHLKKKNFTLKHQRQMKKLPKFEKYYLCDQKILFVKLN